MTLSLFSIVLAWSISVLAVGLFPSPKNVGIFVNHPQIGQCESMNLLMQTLQSTTSLTNFKFSFINSDTCGCNGEMGFQAKMCPYTVIKIEALHNSIVLDKFLSWSVTSLLLEPLFQTPNITGSPFTDALTSLRYFDILISITCTGNSESYNSNLVIQSDCIHNQRIAEMMKIFIDIIPLHQRPAWTQFALEATPPEIVISTVIEFADTISSCLSSTMECTHLYENNLQASKTRLIEFTTGISPTLPDPLLLSVNTSQLARQFTTQRTTHKFEPLGNMIDTGHANIANECNMSANDFAVLENMKFCIDNRILCETVLTERMRQNMTLDSMDSVDLSYYKWFRDEDTSRSKDINVSILCMTYTMSHNHDRVADISATWGAKCDGYIAFSNTTNDMSSLSIITVSLPIYIKDKRMEDYNQMWVKSQSIWSFVESSGLISEFQYFLLGGDDMYVIPDNLRWFLQSPIVLKYQQSAVDYYGLVDFPMYLGRPIRTNSFREFISGGSGYILNSVSIRILNNALRVDSDLRCLRELSASMEDLLVGSCLLHAGLEAFPFPMVPSPSIMFNQDTALDSSSHSIDNIIHVWLAQLFHPLSPSEAFEGTEEWYTRMTIHAERGSRCCSPLSISFQNIKPPVYNMRCIHDALYRN